MEAAADSVTPSGSPARLLTVGIPVFNGKALLRSCLESVLCSSLPRDCFEIIVADDGSSEPETLSILRELETSLATYPGFFRVLSLGTNSGGAARPRNRILDDAIGEYVFFVDSDDTIGDLALERIAEAVATTPADWVALNQVPVNGRAGLCRVREPHIEVSRAKALTTLTVHKVFRRAEIERQQLRFDESLPSGQDVSFAFSYILNASRFLMLGAYDYYYLIHHGDNLDEPAHLSRRARTAQARIEKNERILRSMITALHHSGLPEAERREITAQVALPRVLIQQQYLSAIVKAGPRAGRPALRRLSRLLDDPLVSDLAAAGLKQVTGEQLDTIARSDWLGLAYLMYKTGTTIPPSRGPAWVARARRLVAAISGRTRHRRVLDELARLRSSVAEIIEAQRRIEATLQTADPPDEIVEPASEAPSAARLPGE